MAQEGLNFKSKIQQSILENKKQPALIPFITAGFPSLQVTKELLYKFQEKNVAAIELGIPFSDPLADGPIIQGASKYAIDNGITLNKIFELLEGIKKDFNTPIILFTYFNIILNYGLEDFVKKANELNISGIISPDLPIEEAQNFKQLCKKYNIDFIMLVAPTSGEERIKKIVATSSGFIYLVSSTGVTGVREGFSQVLDNILQEIKKYTSTPVSVGFGVSKPEHIKELKKLGVQGAIIGSAFIKIIDEHKDDKSKIIRSVSDFVDSLYIEG